jgi:Spy/CpxP family protein refolding chaperone
MYSVENLKLQLENKRRALNILSLTSSQKEQIREDIKEIEKKLVELQRGER